MSVWHALAQQNGRVGARLSKGTFAMLAASRPAVGSTRSRPGRPDEYLCTAAGQETIKLRPADAAGIPDAEFQDLIRAALRA